MERGKLEEMFLTVYPQFHAGQQYLLALPILLAYVVVCTKAAFAASHSI
jgi:hypothetical protein